MNRRNVVKEIVKAMQPEPEGPNTPDPHEMPSIVDGLRRMAARQATEFVRMGQKMGEQALHDGKDRAAAQISAVGGAVRRAADKLHDQDSEALADYVDSAADRVETVARHIEQSNLDGLAKDAESLARRKPLLFLGGLFVAGIASAQLLRRMQIQIDTTPDKGGIPTDPVD